MERLRVSTTTRDDVQVVSVGGDLDITTVDLLVGEAGAVVDRGSPTVIDMSDLDFIDSTGLGALVDLHQRAEGAGGSLRLEGVRDPARRLLEITKLTDLLDVG